MNELPYYPFWFTPAQLAGRLIVNTSSGEIYYFELTLPADKHLNVGMWHLPSQLESIDYTN